MGSTSYILKATQQEQQRYGADVDWGVLDGVHTGATWRILVNGPYAAVMRGYVKLFCHLLKNGTGIRRAGIKQATSLLSLNQERESTEQDTSINPNLQSGLTAITGLCIIIIIIIIKIIYIALIIVNHS